MTVKLMLQEHRLTEVDRPEVRVGSTEEVLQTLDAIPLQTFTDRITALPVHFDQVLMNAVKMLEPEAQFVQVPQRTLKTLEDLEAWLREVKAQLEAELVNGPINIR